MELKKILREKFLLKRRNFDEMASFYINNIICQSIQNLILSLISQGYLRKLDKEVVIGLYWPIKGEPDLLKLTTNTKWVTGIPKIQGPKMDFFQYSIGSEIEKSSFSKLMQPKNNNKLYPNIVIVPAIAYSLNGYRLGFGAGHYDRYFVKNKNTQSAIKIGVCFHENLYENLPQEIHDIQLDYVVTDKITIAI